MNYKPDEQELMAYLYGELDVTAKARVEQYLRENDGARAEFEKLAGVSGLLKKVEDKEVIAPPIFLPEKSSRFYEAPYFKTIMSIAASVIIIMLAARFAGIQVDVSGNEFRLSFGEPRKDAAPVAAAPALTEQEVRDIINQSLVANNNMLTQNWEATQKDLQKSIGSNLVMNSDRMNDLVKQASLASREQVQQYVTSLQTENMKMVKDYFTLTSAEQKQYIEGLLVDFAKYLQQQRNDDLQLVQLRLNNLEENTSEFKQETEQILTSIISGVGTPVQEKGTKY